MGSDPYYIRRYPDKDGKVMHIVQARPDRSGHVPTQAERQNRIDFAERYGAQRHAEFMERKWKGQTVIPFQDWRLTYWRLTDWLTIDKYWRLSVDQ